MNLIEECVELVKEMAGDGYLYFDTAVQVKLTPHSYPFAAWAVCAAGDSLRVMDAGEQWHLLTAADTPASLLAGSLYQRLRMMRRHYKKAS